MPYPKGKKQSPEAAAKRKQTMMERYGVTNCGQMGLQGESLKGRKVVRTAEHQQNIIDAKRKNGTLSHKDDTKEKIRKSIREIYDGDNPPITISDGNNVNHDQGYVGNLYCRSSYEKTFVQYCIDKNIQIETAETKEFRLPYTFDGKKHFYYPDFYLPDYDIVVEIKPLGMMIDEKTQEKLFEAAKRYNYMVLTEEELENLDEHFLFIRES